MDPWKADKPFAFSFCNEEGETGFVRWRVDPFTRMVVVNRKEWRELRDFFAEPSITTVWFNYPFDYRMLGTLAIEVLGPFAEVMFSMFLAKRDFDDVWVVLQCF